MRGTDSFRMHRITCTPSSCSVKVTQNLIFNCVFQGQVDDLESLEVSPEHEDVRRPARESELPPYKLHNTLECDALFN